MPNHQKDAFQKQQREYKKTLTDYQQQTNEYQKKSYEHSSTVHDEVPTSDDTHSNNEQVQYNSHQTPDVAGEAYDGYDQSAGGATRLSPYHPADNGGIYEVKSDGYVEPLRYNHNRGHRYGSRQYGSDYYREEQ